LREGGVNPVWVAETRFAKDRRQDRLGRVGEIGSRRGGWSVVGERRVTDPGGAAIRQHNAAVPSFRKCLELPKSVAWRAAPVIGGDVD
jgi:hypothetical protein